MNTKQIDIIWFDNNHGNDMKYDTEIIQKEVKCSSDFNINFVFYSQIQKYNIENPSIIITSGSLKKEVLETFHENSLINYFLIYCRSVENNSYIDEIPIKELYKKIYSIRNKLWEIVQDCNKIINEIFNYEIIIENNEVINDNDNEKEIEKIFEKKNVR